jgi:DNA-binding winged helix-turn-helix (wHTH) protein
MLLERPGEIVTREELRGRIWPNESFGDFDQAVNVAIAKLRSALGDSALNPRYVETLPRRGYRFIADVALVNRPTNNLELVHEVASSETQDRAPLEVAGKAAPKHLPWQHAWQTLALALVLLILIV